MARRYRLEYLKRKKKKEREKQAKQLEKQAMMLEKQGEVQKEDDKKEFLKEVLGWVLYIAVIIAMTYLIVTYVGQRTKVSGDSMETALQDGDNLIVDKISYRFRDPERFEIIVFPYKYAENTYYIKRIIGLPGESVQIKDGYVYINGERLEENYGLERMESAGIAEDIILLGEDEYFVLGDNRNNSSDSRSSSVGILTREDLIGRAWVRIWPLRKLGVIPHE